MSGANIHSIKAPLVEIIRVDPSYQPDKTEPLGFGVLVQFQYDDGLTVEGKFFDGISYGEAFFDVHPAFPCFALFLDPQNALLLNKRTESNDVYKRVGLGKFLRSSSQQYTEPLAEFKPKLKINSVPYGPMTRDRPKKFVTII